MDCFDVRIAGVDITPDTQVINVDYLRPYRHIIVINYEHRDDVILPVVRLEAMEVIEGLPELRNVLGQ